MAIHGPSAREVAGPKGDGSAAHPGLRYVLTTNSEKAAALVSRLQTLIGSL